jgi:hypothetical protein
MTTNFPGSLDSYADHADNVDDVMAADVNNLGDAIEALQARVGITATGVTTTLAYNMIQANAKVLFYTDTAPQAFTLDNTMDDKLVFVTKGSAAGGQTGGQAHSAGTWTQPNHTHTGPSHTHAAGSLVGGNHTHPITRTGGSMVGAEGTSEKCPAVTDSGGSGSSISGSTGAEGTGATGGGATANTWRPASYNFILCTKNSWS